jgi:Ca2+-binding RTX toxin-like protein
MKRETTVALIFALLTPTMALASEAFEDCDGTGDAPAIWDNETCMNPYLGTEHCTLAANGTTAACTSDDIIDPVSGDTTFFMVYKHAEKPDITYSAWGNDSHGDAWCCRTDAAVEYLKVDAAKNGGYTDYISFQSQQTFLQPDFSTPLEVWVFESDSTGNTHIVGSPADMSHYVEYLNYLTESQADYVSGTKWIYGQGGDDYIYGGGAADTLSGGDDNDIIFGFAGDDAIDGGSGWDTIEGGRGVDTIEGGPGRDTIDGGDGGDFLYGDGGKDTIDGGDGGDTIEGGSHDDTLSGGDDDDFIFGDAGHDTIDGGNHQDYMSGGNGNDTLCDDDTDDEFYGNSGSDTLWFGSSLTPGPSNAGASMFSTNKCTQLGSWWAGLGGMHSPVCSYTLTTAPAACP